MEKHKYYMLSLLSGVLKKKTYRNREQIGGGAVKWMKLVKGVKKYNPSSYKNRQEDVRCSTVTIVERKVLVAQSCLFETPWTVPARLLCPWDSPDKNTGVGCHSFHQGIFPTQALNPGLPHCRQILYHLSHKSLGKPKKTGVGCHALFQGIFLTQGSNPGLCIAGRFFNI